MVQLQEAVRESKKFLEEVFPANSENYLKLEGVERTEDSKFWLVTFSFWDQRTPLDQPLPWQSSRIKKYKTVKLRVQDGEFFGVNNSDL